MSGYQIFIKGITFLSDITPKHIRYEKRLPEHSMLFFTALACSL